MNKIIKTFAVLMAGMVLTTVRLGAVDKPAWEIRCAWPEDYDPEVLRRTLWASVTKVTNIEANPPDVDRMTHAGILPPAARSAESRACARPKGLALLNLGEKEELRRHRSARVV